MARCAGGCPLCIEYGVCLCTCRLRFLPLPPCLSAKHSFCVLAYQRSQYRAGYCGAQSSRQRSASPGPRSGPGPDARPRSNSTGTPHGVGRESPPSAAPHPRIRGVGCIQRTLQQLITLSRILCATSLHMYWLHSFIYYRSDTLAEFFLEEHLCCP